MNFNKNISPKKIAIIIFIAGLFIGVLTTVLIIIINKTFIQNNSNFMNNKSRINNKIQSEDLVPRLEVMNMFSGKLIEKKSDKELIVSINDKNIRVILDENTKIIKQQMKTEEQQRLDRENYDRKRKENPDGILVPDFPFLEVEIPLSQLELEKSIQIISEENVIGKNEIRASKIIVN